jgi:hypothetical protein
MGIVTGYLSQLVSSGIKLLVGGSAVSSSNPLPVLSKPEVVSTATGTMGALNAEVVIAVTSEYRTAAIFLTNGTLSGIVAAYYSVDGGTTYNYLIGRRMDTSNTSTEFAPNGSNLIGRSFEYAIPIGCTHLKALCTSYTSGSSAAKIVLSSTAKLQQSIVALDASVNRIGFTAASGIMYTDTTSALGSSATFTSTVRDLTVSTSGFPFSSSAAYGKTASICVVQDVAFTVQLLGSTDNFAAVSEIYRSIPATLVGSNYVVELDSHSSVWRYFQYKIVNGVSAAARTRGVSKFLAN